MIAAIARWMREEARLLGLASWASDYHGPPDPLPCTARDPRCARLAERQDAVYQAMRRMKSHLLDREITSAAATDVRATIHRALAVRQSPVVAVKRRVAK
jgi:hypothetical protein